jgi:hypothetical protein
MDAPYRSGSVESMIRIEYILAVRLIVRYGLIGISIGKIRLCKFGKNLLKIHDMSVTKGRLFWSRAARTGETPNSLRSSKYSAPMRHVIEVSSLMFV